MLKFDFNAPYSDKTISRLDAIFNTSLERKVNPIKELRNNSMSKELETELEEQEHER